jgi:23S rRNA pseudouridine2605 synthase
MAQERLQKILARAGVASRRAAEALIAKGEVRINGRVVSELGARADALRDRVEVSGERIVVEKPAYYVLNKPREVVTTLKDPEGRPTIADLMKTIPERVFPVGRLDFHTSGVLLLTNDGDLGQALLHPRRAVPKTYVVKVKGHVGVRQLDALRQGVTLDDGHRTAPAHLFVVREERATTWLQISITEGKNRQIHRMLEAVGSYVMRLSRVAFAGLTTEGMRPGDYRPLTNRELMKLERDYKNPATKQKHELARIERHAQSGFQLDGDEKRLLAVVRAPRGPRRGNVSTRLAEAQAEREAEEAPKPFRGKRPLATRGDRGDGKQAPARFAPARGARGDRKEATSARFAPALGARGDRKEATSARLPPAREARGGRKGTTPGRFPPARDARDDRKQEMPGRFPPERDARGDRKQGTPRFPPARDARGDRKQETPARFPPARDARGDRKQGTPPRLPPAHDARGDRKQGTPRFPPARDARGDRKQATPARFPPAREAREDGEDRKHNARATPLARTPPARGPRGKKPPKKGRRT